MIPATPMAVRIPTTWGLVGARPCRHPEIRVIATRPDTSTALVRP